MIFQFQSACHDAVYLLSGKTEGSGLSRSLVRPLRMTYGTSRRGIKGDTDGRGRGIGALMCTLETAYEVNAYTVKSFIKYYIFQSPSKPL